MVTWDIETIATVIIGIKKAVIIIDDIYTLKKYTDIHIFNIEEKGEKIKISNNSLIKTICNCEGKFIEENENINFEFEN